MSDGTKFFLQLLLVVLGLFVAYKIVASLLASLLSLIFPIAIIAAIGFVAYVIISRKALGGGRRTRRRATTGSSRRSADRAPSATLR